MRPIDTVIMEVQSETPLIKTLRLDRSLDPHPGQYAMVWIRGLDEVPMSFSGTHLSEDDQRELIKKYGVYAVKNFNQYFGKERGYYTPRRNNTTINVL